MSTKGRNNNRQSTAKAESGIGSEAKSPRISQAGIPSTREFNSLMESVIDDLLHGRLSPRVASAVNSSAGKMWDVLKFRAKNEGKHFTFR